MDQEFTPEINLLPEEVAELAAVCSHPGFKVWQKVCKSTVDAFTVRLQNTDSADEKAVLTRHMESRVAAMFYESVAKRVNQEISDYVNNMNLSDKPIDSAAGLDMGEMVNFTINEDMFLEGD